ncbi:MAG: efflux RND transporter permease subunit [Verrucomicrobiota bacterium]
MKSAFTDIFVKRPVLAIVVSLLIVVTGVQALFTLSVRQYPRSEIASIVINTVYVGADAELVRGFITTPIERAIAAADGIDYIKSESRQGISTITARLRLNYDATRALSEISSKVDQVRGDLPPEAEVPVINIQSADSEFAAAYLSFSSDILEANEITDYLVRAVQPRLSALEGVQRAEILGGRIFAMRIWLKADRMAALNISPSEVRRALAQNNYLAAIGQTKGQLITANLTANTDLNSIADFERLVIRQQGDSVIRLQDVAEVVLGAESYDAEVRFSGQKAVFVGMFSLPNANVIDVIDRVRQEMAAIQSDLPSGLDATIAYDSTVYIEESIVEVTKTLLETLLIVIIVIFLFIGNFRAVIVPVLAIPLSLIGAVFLMQIFGFTVNLLTLLAVVLSVGLVVDDAIVVVENVERHLRNGMAPHRAAIVGARELVGPIIAMTLTLVAVYAPIGLQGGLTGSLFREFAFTLAGAVFISGIVALTLSPMLASKLLKGGEHERGLARLITNGFDRIREIYGAALDVALGIRPVFYFCWLVIAVLTVPMFTMSNKELAPTEDQGVVFGILEMPANASIEELVRNAEYVNEQFESIPETEFTFQITTPNFGFSGMVVEPWAERDRSIFEIQADVASQVSTVPGVQIIPILPPALPGGSNFPVEFVIASTAEPEFILDFARQLQQTAMESGNFPFMVLDTKIDQPQVEIVIDREKASAMGLNMQQVGADVGSMVGGNFVNRFNIDGRSYKVIPQIERTGRLNAEQLKQIYVTGPNGGLVPLSTIADLERQVQPRSLNRFQQLNAVTLQGVTIQPLGEALAFLEEEAAKILPQGYTIDYTGEARQLKQEGNRFLPAMSFAILLIFLVLAVQFNSFRDPLVILLGSVPLAMFGALFFTFLKIPNPNVAHWTDGWTTTLNIYSQVGMVTLIGLIAKNGILMVEFANQLQRQGRLKRAAILEASKVRLRPILMTSVATIAGHFPLVLVTGPGAEARNSIGLVLVGGMSIGTLFTLFFVPALYMLIARDRKGRSLMADEEARSAEEEQEAASLQ